LATKNGPAVYATGPEVSVRVPLGGVAAKLSIPSKPAAEQSKKATKARGLKAPDWKARFLFIMFLESKLRQKMAACRKTFCRAFPVSESLRVVSEEASDSSTGPKNNSASNAPRVERRMKLQRQELLAVWRAGRVGLWSRSLR